MKKSRAILPVPNRKTTPCLGVFIDGDYKTCIAVSRADGHVVTLKISATHGLHLTQLADHVFDTTYRLLDTCPVDRAATTYAEFMQYLGATDDALTQISQFITLTTQEIHMAKKKASERTHIAAPITSEEGGAVTNTPSGKGKSTAKSPSEKSKSTITKTVDHGAAKKKSGSPQTASQLFQLLIMEGKLTDDKIFEDVKEAFGLDDKKRGYVGWYRNHLKKTGQNPPNAKVVVSSN